jgi:hypothetical protein
VPERPHATQEDKEKVNNSYLVFLRDYATVFREEPPRHLWPRPIGNGGVELPGCSICGSTCSHKCLA